MTIRLPKVWFILTVLLSVLSFCANAQQTTKIRGIVTDAETGEPMPIVSVTVPGTTIGTTTDFNGIYSIETRQDVTEITALYLSYETQSKPVMPGIFNQIDFSLQPSSTGLETIVVKRGEDPAYELLRRVYRHKKYNNPDEKETYSYSSYTKMELDIVDIKPEFRNRRMQQNFGFVFQHMDTSAITGKPYLPVMISESSSDYYYRKNPKLSREIVRASRVSGIEEDFNLAQFTGQLYVKVNLYENYINIFEVNFASPLSDHGPLFYNFFLVDSVRVDNRKIYKVRFHPRGKGTPVFDGEVNIDSATYALTSARMRIPKGLNLNWIRDLVIESDYELMDSTQWFPVRDWITADFSIVLRDSAKMSSFMGSRQINYADISINQPIPPEIFENKASVVYDAAAVVNNDEEYWRRARPYELSKREQNIYSMVDSVKDAPLFKSVYSLIETVLFGYYKPHQFPYIEYGPIARLYSFNKYEGSRFQLGARTTKDFSEKFRLSGYGAYSTKDGEFKGGGSVEYMISRTPTFTKLTFGAQHDVIQLGASPNAFSSATLFGSIFSRGGNEKLTKINQYNLSFEKEWTENISNVVGLRYRQLYPTKYVDFLRPDSTRYGRVVSSEIRLGARFSKDEIVIRRPFVKASTYSRWPVVMLDLTMGMKNLLNSQDEYYRLELNIDHIFHLAPLGRSKISVGGGKIFGKVPFPLLKLHEGNSTYFYDRMAFSCMDFYEFASDLWVQGIWEHHFRGFFLGKIPLLKKLQWREVLTVKALWGTLSDRNNGSLSPDILEAKLLFPSGMSSVEKPYVEMGFGIENIFRIIRIDAMWRLTHRNGYNGKKVDNFSINFSMHLDF